VRDVPPFPILILRGEPRYPPLLERIPDPPPLLHVLGDPALLARQAVAVVGTRRPTREGLLFAEQLGADLAARGIVVVSGMAYGIDAAAHRGALSTGFTVAVLASGVDVPYPRGNRELYLRILATGAVLSELPRGAPARAHQFLRRNRIISGLALGTVVVEAGERSGALVTARHAQEQNREVFAVPGSPLRETSAGTNALLKDGAALVRDWRDVVAELENQLEATAQLAGTCQVDGAGLSPAGARPRPTADGESSDGGALDANLRHATRELASILTHLTTEPRHVDDLHAVGGLEMPLLLAGLFELELRGVVRQLPGMYFLRVSRGC